MDVATRTAGEPLVGVTLIEAVRTTLAGEMARDGRVVVLGQDVGALGGVFRGRRCRGVGRGGGVREVGHVRG